MQIATLGPRIAAARAARAARRRPPRRAPPGRCRRPRAATSSSSSGVARARSPARHDPPEDRPSPPRRSRARPRASATAFRWPSPLTGSPPATSSIRRTGPRRRTAAPWTKSAVPAPAAGGPTGARAAKTESPSASARGCPQADRHRPQARSRGRSVATLGSATDDPLRLCGNRRRHVRALRRGRRSAPGRRRGDGELLAQPSVGSVARNYNLLLERAAERADLEALVLLHQDVEIVDPRFAADRPRHARRPRGGGRRLRGGDRGPRARVVGGLDHLGVGDPALRGVRGRRRGPGRLVARRRRAPRLRRDGGGRRDRRLPDRPVAHGRCGI